MNMEHWWNNTGRGNLELLGEKPVVLPLCQAEIPHGLPWNL
jgi:hypothetical protein